MGYILDTNNNIVYSEGDAYDGGILKYIKNIGADVGEPDFLIQVQRTDVVNDGNSIVVTPTAEILDDFVVWNSPNPPTVVVDCNPDIQLVNLPAFPADFEELTDANGAYVRIKLTKANANFVLLFCSERTGGFERDANYVPIPETFTFVTVAPVGGYYIVEVKKTQGRTVEEVYIKQQGCVNYKLHNYTTNINVVTDPTGIDPRTPFIAANADRTINLTQFKQQLQTEGILTCLGYGFPLYGNVGLEIKQDKVSPILTGISNIYTNAMKRVYEDTNYYKVNGGDPNGYYFQQLLKMVLDWGRIASSQEFGDTSGIHAQNSSSPVEDWYWPSGITAAGWRQIGSNIGNNSQVVDATNNSGGSKWLMMDDESGTTTGTNGQLDYSGRIQAVKWICEGINASSSNRAIYYGAVPVTGFSGQILGNTAYPFVNDSGTNRYDRSQYFGVANNIPDAEVYYETQILTGNPSMQLSMGRCASDYTSYVGYPWIKTQPKYNKVSNAFVLNSSGYRRYYDGDNRYESINGHNVILKTFMDQYMKDEYHGGVNNITGSQQFVDSVYRFANTLIERICVMSRKEKVVNDNTLNSYDNNIYPLNGGKDRRNIIGGVIRPMTEPTAYSHHTYAQLVGDDFIEYFVWFSLLSGVTMLELWEDDYIDTYYWAYISDETINGLTPNENERQGHRNHRAISLAAITNTIGCLNDTKHLKFIQCVRDFHAVFHTTDRINWKFVRFFYPYVGELRREHIATGIYTGTMFCLFVTAPTLETAPLFEDRETCTITFTFGSMVVTETIRGGENLIKVYNDLEAGLTATQFKMEYTNIYGQQIRANGNLGARSAHYF